MTAWQSVFDASPTGKCLVEAGFTDDWRTGGSWTPQWSGQLGKGDTSPVFQGGSFSNVDMTLAVDSAGAVGLTIAGTFAEGMAVRVTPLYDISSLGVRASSMTMVMNSTVGDASNGGDVSTVLTPATAPAVTPDPALLTSANATAKFVSVQNFPSSGSG